VSGLLLSGRILAARLLVVAMMLAASACEGTVNWHATPDYPVTAATPAPSPSCAPLADAPGCQPPAPAPTGPDGVDYVPYCLPGDPPGAYCEPQP
jgi:hypothetical protein